MNMQRMMKSTALVLLLLLAFGCAAKKAYTSADREMQRENYDKAVLGFSKAIALDPGQLALAVGNVAFGKFHFRDVTEGR